MTAVLPDGSTVASRVKGDREPVICGVCRRRANTGFGWAGSQGRPILWTCDDPVCGAVARSVYEMPRLDLDAYEQRARDEAGQAAGAYLEGIGKTDLGELSQDEWRRFLDQVLVGFETALRRYYAERAAPF